MNKFPLRMSVAALAALMVVVCGPASAGDAGHKLDEVLAAQDEETQSRYQYRHPKETLEFFGIKPGMTVEPDSSSYPRSRG